MYLFDFASDYKARGNRITVCNGSILMILKLIFRHNNGDRII